MSSHEEIIHYNNLAETGDATAQCWLGWVYQNGKGVPQDFVEAVKWYRKAAEQGHADAQINLGSMYRNGKGVPQDDAEVVKWYRKAAEQGHVVAQFWLGSMYQNAKGVPQDDAEAVKWYRKAAEQGHVVAQFWLGSMYQDAKGVPQDNAEVVKWYRKVAEQGKQGYADALNKLDQMKAEGIKGGKTESKTLPEPKIAVTTSGVKNKKSSTVGRHLRDAEECKALLDACTPHLYIHNAFRVSGIPVDASTRDSKRRMDELKIAADAGDLQDELTHAFALDPMSDLDKMREAIREAAQRFQDPEHRIIDEFFWFWPFDPGKSDTDPALRALRNHDKGTAFKIWSETLSENHSHGSTVAKHNLAVMCHLSALDAEQDALKSILSAEQLVTLSKDWRTCFKLWEELADDETLWSLVADRIGMVGDPQLKPDFADQMRATLPEAIGLINAMLAIDYAECGKVAQATEHINYMKETHQGKDNIQKTLYKVTKPHKERVTNAVKNATSVTGKKPAQAAKAALELLQAISKPMKVIQTILQPEDHERIDLCDSVAEACLKCQGTRIKEIEELNFSIADKMSDIKNDLLPYLSKIKKFPGMSDDSYEKCADAVARYIRELYVSECNENKNLIGALRILDVSISVARGREVREQLQEDKAKLINLLKKTTEHNLQMQIRSDEIEVTNEFVRYNDQKISVSRIQGIKYGGFIQLIKGVRTSSYLIDITGGQSRTVHIECKRFLRNEAQAEQDFNRILEALYHQVVPALVQKLAEGIVSGRPLKIGNCSLTKGGMDIPLTALDEGARALQIMNLSKTHRPVEQWNKSPLVPLTDLRFSQYAGQINVSSVKDKGISASMAIRDIWNAALLEFITKAVVEMKVKS